MATCINCPEKLPDNQDDLILVGAKKCGICGEIYCFNCANRHMEICFYCGKDICPSCTGASDDTTSEDGVGYACCRDCI